MVPTSRPLTSWGAPPTGVPWLTAAIVARPATTRHFSSGLWTSALKWTLPRYERSIPINGNTDVPDEIIKLHAKHFDLIFYQFYATWFDQELLLDRFARLSGGRPILHGDSCYTTPKENMPDPYGPQCVSQEIRVEYFRESMYNALARDDFVGWCWCGWMDRWESQEPGKQHSGFQDPFGAFDRLLAQAMKEFSDKMYDVARGIHGPS